MPGVGTSPAPGIFVSVRLFTLDDLQRRRELSSAGRLTFSRFAGLPCVHDQGKCVIHRSLQKVFLTTLPVRCFAPIRIREE
jgi:hypothetical protein